jgi:hypothetical protein
MGFTINNLLNIKKIRGDTIFKEKIPLTPLCQSGEL